MNRNAGIVELGIFQFLLVYLLLVVVLIIMKKAKVGQTKLLLVSSLRMTAQLVLAGFLLTHIFENPRPVFTILYVLAMVVFSVYRALSKNKGLNRRFKLAVGASLAGAGLAVTIFFVAGVVRVNILNPQYTIPLAGMIIGNGMTGVNLALKTFRESLDANRAQAESLLNLGVPPQKILLPYANTALETALLPTLNSMLGMGIIFLPGMMTGQILSGIRPTTAIMYQIAIMISLCAVVCLASFCALTFGYRTLYNQRNQISFPARDKD